MRQKLSDWLQRVRASFSWHQLNPLNWRTSEVKLFLALYLIVMVPVYLLIGFQPTPIADAASYPQLEIASISLKTPVASISLENHELIAPSQIAGVYHSAPNKDFIIGHSSSVFKKLNRVQVGDTLTYDGEEYIIQTMQTLLKSDIDMAAILQREDEPTIILMTCAGTPLPHQDATHRLIITAHRKSL